MAVKSTTVRVVNHMCPDQQRTGLIRHGIEVTNDEAAVAVKFRLWLTASHAKRRWLNEPKAPEAPSSSKIVARAEH